MKPVNKMKTVAWFYDKLDEQEVEELYSPENFIFDKSQQMIVAGRPVTEVNIKVELFPL